MKFLSLLHLHVTFLSCLLCINVHGQTIPEDSARLNVLRFLNQNENFYSKHRIGGAKLSPVLSYRGHGFYAFDLGNGFVLASRTKSLPPILGYSDSGSFSSASSSACFRSFIKQYEQEYRPDFRIYKPSNVSEEVLPLLSDRWHQYEPYNILCPYSAEGESRCVAGCVAISMAELMNYYKYPSQGTGYLEYNDSTGSGMILHTDLSDHKYSWSEILNDYTEAYSESSAQSVAQLIYDCGVSVNMRYGQESSGASIIRQPIALVNNFGYDEGMQLYYRNFFDQVSWDSIMFNELNEGRPILVGGWTGGGGHSYVCDGYDKNGLFHLRMGYPDNAATGYYYFTWSTPDLLPWRDINSPEAGFNVLQSILVGIKPKVPGIASRQRYIYCFSSIKKKEESSEPVTLGSPTEICVYDLSNCGWNHHSGLVGIALKSRSDGRSTDKRTTRILYTYDHEFALEELTDSTYSDTILITIPEDLSPGTYRIVPVYEENGEYIEARTMVGVPNNLQLHVSEGVAELSSPSDEYSELSISDLYFPSEIYRNTSPEFGFRLHNMGAEYSGRLYISLYNDTNPSHNNIFCIQGVSIESGEIQDYKFVRTSILNFPLGEFHLRILSDESLLNDTLNVLYDDPARAIKVLPSPTSIEMTESDTSDSHKIRYYDLSGREVRQNSLIPNSIYIELLPNGGARKRVLK